MTRYFLSVAGLTGMMLAGLGTAQAQAPMPPPAPGVPKPTFSPYLNLARPGGTPAFNYYGLVRPELQFRKSIQNLQNSLATTQQNVGTLQDELGGLPITGHPTQFLNYGGYFLNSGPSAGAAGAGAFGGGGGFGAGRAAPTPPGQGMQRPAKGRR